MNQLSTIATFYKEGGMFMHAVLVIAVVIVAIVLERAIVISRAASLNGRKLADDLVKAVVRGDLTGARGLCARSKAPVARVAQAMLHVGTGDEETLQNAADNAATLCLPDLTKRLPHLGVLANSATLIGLLGTITGLITAISGVGVADAAQRSAYLSAGISEALHTTAFGLVIAIPTLMIQGWLNSRVEDVAQDIDELSVRLSQALAAVTLGSAQVTPLNRPRATGTMPASMAARTAAGLQGGQ
ncbi:MAG: MotA/TolQ/ExbB proton channel family protein [Candidatus Eisenbacteria bacterium]|uniref:MotA/TolQ/ExbB proton channel family protein n=1 Tax=Eiseniibacteriota bacterium TaxID=2212470 RepID=A0A538U2F3_UNCEI|nr:MAG: MotA/TolQ/ExbB proton channel family protein [Candidatus Eisenbacteria bacterium]